MDRRCFLISLVALVFAARVAAAPVGVDDTRVDLGPRFVVGQEHRFQVTMVSRTTTQFLDTVRVRLQEYHQSIRVRRKVVAADEQGATLELVYERVAVMLVAANKTVTYDTQGTNNPEAEELLGSTARNALDRPFTVKVDSAGRFLSVSGNEQDESRKAAVNLIDNDLFARHMAPMYGLDRRPAQTAVGETWSATHRYGPSKTGTFVVTVDSRLESVADGRARIDRTGRVEVEWSELAVNGKSELAGHSVAGHQLWNVEAGALDRSFYQHTIAVTADVEARQILEDKGEIRRRRADMLIYTAIDRVDAGVGALPALPPIPEAVTAPITPPNPPAAGADAPTRPAPPAPPTSPTPSAPVPSGGE